MPIMAPGDLVAPFGGESCCGGELWLAPLMLVLLASTDTGVPLTSPCCGRRFLITDLSKVKFFSESEWREAGEDSPPDHYVIESAFLVPRP